MNLQAINTTRDELKIKLHRSALLIKKKNRISSDLFSDGNQINLPFEALKGKGRVPCFIVNTLTILQMYETSGSNVHNEK